MASPHSGVPWIISSPLHPYPFSWGRTDKQHSHGRDSSSLPLEDCVFSCLVQYKPPTSSSESVLKAKTSRKESPFSIPFSPKAYSISSHRINRCFVLGSETNLKHLLALKLFLKIRIQRAFAGILLRQHAQG